MGGGALHPIESSREGNIGWGGGTSTPCMSSVQDLPSNGCLDLALITLKVLE